MSTYICADCRHIASAGAPAGRCPKCGGNKWHERSVVEKALAEYDRQSQASGKGMKGGRLIGVIIVLTVMGPLFVLCPLGLVFQSLVNGHTGMAAICLVALIAGGFTFAVAAMANLAYAPGEAPAWMANFVVRADKAEGDAESKNLVGETDSRIADDTFVLGLTAGMRPGSDEYLIARAKALMALALSSGTKTVELPATLFKNASIPAQNVVRKALEAMNIQLVLK